MTALAIVIILGVGLLLFLFKKEKKEELVRVTTNNSTPFKLKTGREIKGIDLLPFHIDNLENAIANKDMDIANLAFAKIVELVRQKNVSEKEKYADFLQSLRNEYDQFRKIHNLRHPQQFLPPTNQKKKITDEERAKESAESGKKLDFHFKLGEKISLYYKNREIDDNLEKAIKACEQQIEFAPKAKEAFKYLYKREPLPTHQGYTQLAIIKEKQNKIEEAIALCFEAKKQGWWEEWDARIERLKKKQKKPEES